MNRLYAWFTDLSLDVPAWDRTTITTKEHDDGPPPMSPLRSLLPCVLTLALFPVPATTQEASETRLMDVVPWQSEQSELSYAAYRHNSVRTILEGRIAPHLFLNREGRRFSVELTPKVHLRILRAQSSPVSAPSFMPRLTVYFVPTRNWVLDDREGGTFYSALLSHHSNGQDGDFFDGDGSINQVDGSFSTNFIEIGVHHLFFPVFGWVDGATIAGVSLQQHLWFSQTAELSGRYSETRLNARVDYLHAGRVLKEVDLDIVMMLDDVEGWTALEPKRANWEVTARFAPPAIKDATLFVKLYWGQDYYNIRFANRIRLLQLGLSIDFSTWSPIEYPDA